jgi:hypothetical protein
MRSRTTGLTLRPEGWRLRLVDSVTGQPILWHEEAVARLRALEDELSRLRPR